MQLLPKQQNAVYYLKDSTTKEILYGGAAGGGKSALGCLWLIENCQKFEGSRWLMGRAKLKALKETTLNTFFELSNTLGISDQFTYNAQSNIIKWNNGSEILLKDLFLYPSDPNFDSLGSLEICGAFIDECNQVVYKAWQIVLSRCRYKLTEWDSCGELTSTMKVLNRNEYGAPNLWLNSKGEKTAGLIPKILGSCNPSKNWTYKQFYIKDKKNELKDSRQFIKALPSDNPYLPASYLESLLSLDKTSRERLYYGNWEYDDDPATLIDLDAIGDYFNPTHLTPSGTKYITIDVARKGKDKTVIRVWHGFVCVHRYSIAKSGLDYVVEKVKELQRTYNVSRSNIVADEDGVGGGVVDYLKCKGFVNGSKALNGENYANLKTQCNFIAARMITNRQLGEICSDNSIIDIVSEEMQQVKQKDIDKDGKLRVIGKDVIKQHIGRSPDEFDSIMMRMYFTIVKTYRTRVRV